MVPKNNKDQLKSACLVFRNFGSRHSLLGAQYHRENEVFGADWEFIRRIRVVDPEVEVPKNLERHRCLPEKLHTILSILPMKSLHFREALFVGLVRRGVVGDAKAAHSSGGDNNSTRSLDAHCDVTSVGSTPLHSSISTHPHPRSISTCKCLFASIALFVSLPDS